MYQWEEQSASVQMVQFTDVKWRDNLQLLEH